MATYKVIQDIEADDKLLGPLSLKQFIFALVAVGFAFLGFILVSKSHNLLLAVPVLPFIVVFGILAAPIGGYQSTDVWLAARIRFFLKPHKRVWFQSELKNLVNITAPKKEEKIYTDGLNQDQVRSRLKVLADTLDSRGWAIKDPSLNVAFEPDYVGASDDRLISTSSFPQPVQSVDISMADDILDEESNHVAQNFTSMVAAAERAQKEALRAKMDELRKNIENNNPPKISDSGEKEIIDTILAKKEQADDINSELSKAHHKSIAPLSNNQDEKQSSSNPMTIANNPVIVDKVNTKKIDTAEIPSSQKIEDNGDVVINLR
jgi:PrgI family protein